MSVVGGLRPPVPMTVGAGNGFVPSTVIAGEVSSVVVRLVAPLVPPGRNSLTVPLTEISLPTWTVGALEVNTNRASEVPGLLSGQGSWYQKPLPVRAVTTPRTSVTEVPLRGERCAVPWMSRIRGEG